MDLSYIPDLEVDSVPELEAPMMICAFRGWNDAGESATLAVRHLSRVWSAEPFARIDPEDYYDFQVARPLVELEDGLTRSITWPGGEFYAAKGGGRDVITLIGTEPNLRWRRFCSIVVEMARSYRCPLVITLGALLADVAHSRPVPITGTAVNQRVIEELNLERSRYEGPTGIVGVVHDALGQAGIDSASLWAAVPHYLGVSPNPKAALALVHRVTALTGVPAEVDDLGRASIAYETRVGEMVAQDEDVQAYVRVLEQRADQDQVIDPQNIPSGDALASELERFLRERNEGEGGS